MSGRQDKGPGQRGPKLLSAHLFSRAKAIGPWDKGLGYVIDFTRETAGTRPLMSLYVPKLAIAE